MNSNSLVRVFTKGGIISPGDLLKVIEAANFMGCHHIHLGSRQDILFPVEPENMPKLKQMLGAEIDYDLNDNIRQNIVSSYVALDIMPSKKWLASHIYHYILDSFVHKPKVRINIVDPSQSLVPLFTGKINFIASNLDNYWYLYLRFEDIHPTVWRLPVLFYGYDLHKIAAKIEDCYHNGNLDLTTIFSEVIAKMNLNIQNIEEDLIYPDSNFPYYEGINRISDGKYWLGIYWRNNQFDTMVLEALAQLCQTNNIGKVSLTPWKSLIVKTITEENMMQWEKLMGKFGMNMRHSSLELNWHLPAMDNDALTLKNYLVRELDKLDISTSGLTFTIKTKREITPFSSVVIEENEKATFRKHPTYNVLYSKDFNPNNTTYFYFVKDIKKEIIPLLLVELSHKYYEQLQKRSVKDPKPVPVIANKSLAYQCRNCLTIYDEKIGDPEAGFLAGTSFDSLPDDYVCALCGSEKLEFKPIS